MAGVDRFNYRGGLAPGMSTIDDPGMGIGTYQNTDHDTCTESVRLALEAGYRHIDTAAGYNNEAAVGRGIEQADVDRESIFLATKVSTDQLAYDDVIESAEASLEKLGVDTIDLLYVHWPIRSYDPEETLAAFDDLRDRGVIRHVGLSNFTPPQLDEARDLLDAPVFAHQVECHPLLPQDALRAYAAEHDHHFVAYTPIARNQVAKVDVIREIADAHDATPAQVSLAWLLERGAIPIPKATGEAHIRENLAANELQLSDEQLRRIDDIDQRDRIVDFEEAPWN